MGRRTEGWPTIADYSVWTNELSREELMIIIDGIRNHRINQAKRKLQFLRAQRDLHRGYGRMRNKQIKNQSRYYTMEKVNKEIMIQTLAELADMLPADGRKRDFISIRIARRGYTIYRMTPQTTAEIMTARHINKEPDKSEACIAAMAHSVALAIVGSRNVFAGIRIWFLRRRIMRRASLPELFDAYNKTLAMLPIEDISQITAIMLGLAETIAKEP